MRIKRGIYGLKQVAVFAYYRLVKHLKTHGYNPAIVISSIFSHKTRKAKFCLCVDYFSIKYHSIDDAYHLLHSLKEKYSITTD